MRGGLGKGPDMRIVLGAVLLAALGWSVYWMLAAASLERGTAAWFAARAAEGWVVDHGPVSVSGFPSRFDLRIETVELADPGTGLAWTAPVFYVHALAYRPRHVIAVWPERQSIATPKERITVTSEDMRASAQVAAGPEIALERAVLQVASLGLVSSAGWSASLAGGQMAMRRADGPAPTYEIAASARDVTLPSRVAQVLSDRGLVSEVAEGASVEARVVFDRPWDRRAVEDRRPQPREIDLTLARATWGALDLRLAGAVQVDAEGVPEGSVTVKAQNWREILALAMAAGVVPEAAGPVLERGLAALAGLSGNPDTIDVPLAVENGRVTVGGVVPLGPAPRLVLR